MGRGIRGEEAEGMELGGVMPERVGTAAFEGDDQFIGLHSFGDDDVEFVIGIGRDADAAALSDGVAVEAAVGAEVFSFEVDDGAGLIGDKGGEEIVYFNLTDEADTLAILFIGIGKAELAGGPADFGFGEMADGEDGVLQLLGLEEAEEVALIFFGIAALMELRECAVARLWSGVAVVTGGDGVKAVLAGPL